MFSYFVEIPVPNILVLVCEIPGELGGMVNGRILVCSSHVYCEYKICWILVMLISSYQNCNITVIGFRRILRDLDPTLCTCRRFQSFSKQLQSPIWKRIFRRTRLRSRRHIAHPTCGSRSRSVSTR